MSRPGEGAGGAVALGLRSLQQLQISGGTGVRALPLRFLQGCLNSAAAAGNSCGEGFNAAGFKAEVSEEGFAGETEGGKEETRIYMP